MMALSAFVTAASLIVGRVCLRVFHAIPLG